MPVAEEVRYVLSEKLPNIVSFMPVEDIITVSFLILYGLSRATFYSIVCRLI